MNNLKKVFTFGVVLATVVWTMGVAALVPTANAQTALEAGDLIKGSYEAVYYYAGDGDRYVYPQDKYFFTWRYDFSDVMTITDEELASISLATNILVRPGTKLVKIQSIPKVYAVGRNGQLYWVNGASAADTLFGADWTGRVMDVQDSFWSNYTDTGTELDGTWYPDGNLIKSATAPDVYLVWDGMLRRIASEAAFNANRFMWEYVSVAPQSVIDSYTMGTEVTGAEADLLDDSQGGGYEVPAEAEGTLTVSLASDTPASASVPQGANADFTKLVLTAGGSNVSIDKMYLTRYGLSNNNDAENIKLLDMDGVQWGNTAGNLNSNGVATITFTTPLSLTANSTNEYMVRSGVPTGAIVGNTLAFGIADETGIDCSAAVMGSFPVVGNEMDIVGTTIGSVSVSNDGTVVDTTPDAGDTDVVLNKFKVTAGSTEGIVIETITLLESGSASLSDTTNIELYDVTNSQSLGEVDWNSAGKAVFTGLNIPVSKGDTNRFKVLADIVSGAGQKVNADLIDGSDVLMTVKGATYGFYITPDNPSGWDGKGSSDQKINSGALNISLADSTPPVGNITEADDQLLTVWDFEAKGEDVTITNVDVTLTPGGEAAGADFISCVLRDETGDVVAGPQDGTNTTDGATDTLSFSDTFIVPIGVHEYSFECNVFDSDNDDWGGGTNDTVQAGIAAATDVTAKGFTTNTSITPDGSFAVNGKTQTIKFAQLSATTLSNPAEREIVPGANNVLWMTASLSAAGSGEDVMVDTVVIEDNFTDTSGNNDGISVIDNMEIWADLDGDGTYETSVSDIENPTVIGGSATYTQTFTMDPLITVPKDEDVRIALYADLASSAGVTDIHQIRIDQVATAVSGYGDDTGTTVQLSAAASGNGQNFTVAGNGSLTLTIDASSPTDYSAPVATHDYLVEGGANQVTLVAFKLDETSKAEDMELDELTITDDGSDALVDKFYLFVGPEGSQTQVASATPSGGTATFYLDDGEVVVPADDDVILTVKADINNIDGTTVAEQDNVIATVNDATTNELKATGLSSGQQVNAASGTNVDGPSFVGLSSVPAVNFADGWTDYYSKSLTTGSNVKIGVIEVTAGDQDINFESGDSNQLSIQISGYATGGDAAGDENITFKDGSGNILAVIAANIDNGAVSAQVDCDFTTGSGSDLTISAGTTKTIEVYADTTGYTAAGDNLQVWLDAAEDDVGFGINGAVGDNYKYGDVLNRGGQYGAPLN